MLRIVLTSILILCLHFAGQSQISYQPNPQIRKSIRQIVWKQELKALTNASNRLGMGWVFLSNEPFRAYEGAIAKYDLNPYDCATPILFMRAIEEELKVGREMTDEEAVRFLHHLKGDIETFIAEEAEPDRQHKYDRIILRTIWAVLQYRTAPQNISQYKKILSQWVKEYGFDQFQYDWNASTAPAVVEAESTTPSEAAINTLPSSTSDFSERNVPITAQINDIILRTVTSYGLNGVYVTNEINFLYSNGDLYSNPSKPIDQIDIPLSKREHPKRWDKWEKRNGVIYVTRTVTGKQTDWKTWHKVVPAAPGQLLNGQFKSYAPWGGAGIAAAKFFSFTPDGKFGMSKVAMTSSGWRPIYSEKNSGGTYQLKGHRISLQFNNGQKEDYFFCFYPDKKDYFVIGQSHFVPREN